MKKSIQLLALAIVLLVGAISCSKDSFDVNQNTNQVTDSTIVYNVILPAAQNNTARLVARNWGWLQNYLGYWARSGTYAPNTAEETYDITTGFQAQIWANTYDNLYDYQQMQRTAALADADFYEGIARIMKAHDFAILVDIYNDVPYTEALQGAGNTTPHYDKAIDIYKDLLRQIDTGIALIKDADLTLAANEGYATNDVMFGGDQAQWAQFANTIKLRILTKFMNGGVDGPPSGDDVPGLGQVGSPEAIVPGVDLTNEFAIIDAEGSGFLDFDASVNPGYAADKGNPFYNSYVADNTGTATANSVYYKANSYAIGYYGYNGDPRVSRFYVAGNQGIRGVDYGLPSLNTNAAATLAGIGPGVAKSATADQWIITAAESYFLQAECIHRGFMSGDANTTMINGIYASFVSLGSTTGAADTYMANNAGYADVDYTAVEDAANSNYLPGGLYTIISQKWFALNAVAPYEVWSDYRRVDMSPTIHHFVYGSGTGFDPGPPVSVSPANTRTEIPRRLLYPQSEYLYNPVNVAAAPDPGQNSYPFNGVFWDLQ